MPFFAVDPGHYAGERIDNGHCVRFCQVACRTLPHTLHWVAGRKVRGGGVAPYAIIATFDATGRYANATDGTSHAAVFVQETEQGIEVWDQWQGQPVHRRMIRFRDGQGRPVNDGDQFFVVESAPLQRGSDPERVSTAA